MDWTNFSWGPFEGKLLWDVLRNLALNGMGAYFVTRLSAVRRALTGTRSRRLDTLVLILVFGLFSILGNFLGLPIHGAIANTRIVGPIAGGLIGGPWVGAGAGILGGLARYAMGGYTALAALVANVLAGLVGGWVQTGLGYRRITVPVAFLTGVAGELVLKACILTLSKPFDMAWKLEKTIAVPTLLANATAVAIFLLVVKDVYREQEKATADARNQALQVQAELQALRAQVNPHFLFNTLATIGALTRTSPDRAREIVKHLSEFLRRSLHRREEQIPLAEELKTVELYLGIEKARFGPRIASRIEVDPALSHALVPVFSVQVLVENAIKHGIGPRPEGGQVAVTAGREGGRLLIRVEDDGLGLPQDRLDQINRREPGGYGEGSGLRNLQRRLELLCGDPAGLTLSRAREGAGTLATLDLPLSEEAP
ncbi:sensor histidine kinase [Geothrix terrae]|uniref:sensor histidine kinase n=1 Tax=Geothrix terrae TaxID=2922720 RepID=UPI001FACC744|nr:LytS/YhcK type 5TM receptor domain-containing protein [Geothrix terrae]